MIRDAARLLNAKIALDPLIVRIGQAGTGPARRWQELFADEANTVDRAVNTLLYPAEALLSPSNCAAAAGMAEKLVATAEMALSVRSSGCDDPDCFRRERHVHRSIGVRQP